MKVVFLDIDGVLNSAGITKTAQESTAPVGSIPWKAAMIDPSMVARLNRLLAETQAVCVLSSSWRYGTSVSDMQAILESHGFRGHILSRTPLATEMPGDSDRATEIAWWVGAASLRPQDWIALDDLSLPELGERLVQTAWTTGLLDEHVDRAVALLGQEAA